MNTIRLFGPNIVGKAGETVTLRAEFADACWSCIHERRERGGYVRISDQQGAAEHVCEAVIHDDTTDFIVSIGDGGRPDLGMTNNRGQMWCRVSRSEGQSDDPAPTDLGALVFKFGAVSDIHFDVEDSHCSEYAEDLQNALMFMRKEGCECVCSCGDIAQYNDKDYETFRVYYNAHAWAPTGGQLPLFTPMGNHDYLRIYHRRDSVPAGYDSVEMLWQNNVSVFHEPESAIHFFEYGAKWDAPKKTGKRTIKSKLNYWLERHGCIFIFMSIDYGQSTGTPWDDVARGFNRLDYANPYVQQMAQYAIGYDPSSEQDFDYQFYHPEVLCWARDIIEANRDKRVFLFAHHFMPNMAGDSQGAYSRLRVWPMPTSDAIRQKFYSGSNTVSGLTFHFLDRLLRENRHVICFCGHSHYQWGAQMDVCRKSYPVKLPTGLETTPLVDDLNSLIGTEYDYRLYSITDGEPADAAVTVHMPSLSKPTDGSGRSLYGASQGAVVEVYEQGVMLRQIAFKADGEKDYKNSTVATVRLT